jgi:hypothetical protein
MTRPSRSPSLKISSVVSDVEGKLVTDQKIADRAHESSSAGAPQHLCDIVLVMTVNPGFSG